MQQKVGSVKNLQRSARERVKNQAARPERIKNARKRHLKNALQSCGELFAQELRAYYASNPNPGTKTGNKAR
jgi:hypothetical protein